MAHLFNRNVLVGVSGGIAAYKSAELVRLLIQQGASVRVIMTRGAMEFITPLTLQALSGNPVHTELLDAEAEQGMSHIELARWADLLVIAPATADLIARLAAAMISRVVTYMLRLIFIGNSQNDPSVLLRKTYPSCRLYGYC